MILVITTIIPISTNAFTYKAFGDRLEAKAVEYGLSGVILVITYK